MCCLDVKAQITAERLDQFLSGSQFKKILFPVQIKEFYEQLNFHTAWIEKQNNYTAGILLNDLKLSPGLALNEKDYQFSFIESFRNHAHYLQSTDDSLEAEIRITDAAIHFYTDIAYGNVKPVLGYNGLNYSPSCINIPSLLAMHIAQNSLQSFITDITPALPEIAALQEKLKWLNARLAERDFKDPVTSSNKVSWSNQPLLLKLYHLGITDTVVKMMPDSLLRKNVKEAQRQFNLLDDGALRSTILQELNVPLSVRMQQLIFSINYYRWLYCILQDQQVIVVNIPAAYMKVYYNNNTTLEMRMIVGKTTTPTPTLMSTVNEVILYPYWHVPYSIATKELLPIIKRNPAYLEAGNYQVLNGAGKVVDPYSINWHSLSAGYFPYIIRQGTGCDNSLGLLKLNFYSPFGVYLHDTPVRSMFMLGKRFFSHGCMRMEKPIELGHLLLKNNLVAIDTLEDKGCLVNQAPVAVPADVHMPVIVWYNPAGMDSTGRVIFYEDIYHKFEWMKKK
jgi:L,D-transpeptidase YcbB